jgi:hypothetical protein
VRRLLATANDFPSSPILVTRRYVPPKCRFLQEPHGVTSQKTAFFICRTVHINQIKLGLRLSQRCIRK